MNNKNEVTQTKFVVQANAISRGVYRMSTTARRLTAMAMREAKITGKNTVMFRVADFCDALDLEYSGDIKRRIKRGLEECALSTLKTEIQEEKGERWTLFTWFDKVELFTSRTPGDVKNNTVMMRFNAELSDFVKSLVGYTNLDLINFGKLQSQYALRFYEMAMSYAGFAGKDGNKSGEWWFEDTIADLRQRLVIDSKKYKRTDVFRRQIIDLPINEINAAEIGIFIEPEYKYAGKYLDSIRFNCRKVAPNEPRRIDPVTLESQQIALAQTKYPDEFEAIYQKTLEIKQKEPFLPAFRPPESMMIEYALGEAFLAVKAAHQADFSENERKKARK
ncbi:MAG: hypothetical protein Ta2A_19410 [Treponemataceae bacterium]|nr:MAG: hypothetical protein Ta2A_19410 [Treponemataceae bacterium]